MRQKFLGATAAIAALALAGSGSVAAAHQSANHDKVTAAERASVVRQMLAAGLQTAAKHDTLPKVVVDGVKVNRANPYLGEIADPSRVDWSYWNRLLAKQGAQRATSMKAPTAIVWDEEEPEDTLGSNDEQGNAERITGFGSGSAKAHAVRILGALAPPDVDADSVDTEEDQGSIPLATDTGIPADSEAVEISSEIGDGPFGSEGTDTGDFDFFKLSATAGQTLHATTAGSELDTLLVIYDSEGTIVDANDDSNGTFQSKITYPITEDGDYYVMVSGFTFFGGIPEDPFDSSSGTGSGDEGTYDLAVNFADTDNDYYAVKLRKGDVLGGTVSRGSADINVHKYNGDPRIGSNQDLSFIYPSESPLPGGGNGVFGYVAEEAGWYAVSTSDGEGDYRINLEVYRPGSETAGAGVTQTIFLDFDGARVNTAVFGGGGVSTLAPLSSFLGDWGLTRADLNKLINRTVKTVKENIHDDLVAYGLNGNVSVNVLNSRDDADPFGQPNVSRVIVGGTIAQSGVDTIGIAESIDPGNFRHDETALVLLDIVSDPDTSDDASFNAYITPDSNKIKFIGTALGNITSHEIGHFVGSFHVDQFNDTLNLMDQGGNFPLLYGVGDDLVGGTADDPDVDFGVDDYNPNEGLTGLENTLNNTAWAFVLGQ